MPVIASTYKAPLWLIGRHLETIIPTTLRKVTGVTYRRERISTPDNDFLDLDFSEHGNSKVAIITHGLAGDSKGPVVLGMVKQLTKEGWDSIAWNYRSSSGEPNLQKRFSHAGCSEDINTVVEKALSLNRYKEIALIGFSYGGNITLSYLRKEALPREVTKSVVFSAPLDLNNAIDIATKGIYRLYTAFYLNVLRERMQMKSKIHPEITQGINWKEIKTICAFDERFTAPLHGFASAKHYYDSCSLHNCLDEIKIPTLIVSARNDPLLTKNSYPEQFCSNSKNIFLEMPKRGGHNGFMHSWVNATHWSEIRALQFLNKVFPS